MCDGGTIQVPVEIDDEEEVDCDVCGYYCDAGYARTALDRDEER
jgi:hypothetical protein